MTSPSTPEDAAPPTAPAGRRTFLWTAVAALALPGAAVLTSPLLARALGADGRGEMSAVLAPAVLASMLATAGLPDALNVLVARTPKEVRYQLSRGLWLSMLWGVGAAVLLLLSAPLLLVNVPDRIPLFIAVCLTMPVTMAVGAVRGAAQGLHRFSLVNTERWIAVGSRVSALVGFFSAGGLDVPWAVWITWASGLLAGIVYVPLLLEVRRTPRYRPRDSLARLGFKVWAGQVSGLLILRLDQMILAVLVGPRELGLYAIAAAVAEVPQTVVGAIRQIIVSRAASALDVALVGRTSRLCVLASFSAAVAGAVLAPWAVPLVFGSDFVDAVAVTQVLLAATVPMAASTVTGAALLGMGRAGTVSRIQGFGLVCTVAALVTLVPEMGAVGASLASLLTYFLVAALTTAAFGRATGAPVRSLALFTTRDLRDLAALPLRR